MWKRTGSAPDPYITMRSASAGAPRGRGSQQAAPLQLIERHIARGHSGHEHVALPKNLAQLLNCHRDGLHASTPCAQPGVRIKSRKPIIASSLMQGWRCHLICFADMHCHPRPRTLPAAPRPTRARHNATWRARTQRGKRACKNSSMSRSPGRDALCASITRKGLHRLALHLSSLMPAWPAGRRLTKSPPARHASSDSSCAALSCASRCLLDSNPPAAGPAT